LLTRALKDIFKVNLGVKKHERVLLFTDRPSENEKMDENDSERRSGLRSISLLIEEIGKSFCKTLISYEYPATESHGA